MAKQRHILEIEGRRVPVSNLEKVLYPEGRYPGLRRKLLSLRNRCRFDLNIDAFIPYANRAPDGSVSAYQPAFNSIVRSCSSTTTARRNVG
jgi:hypothetical protein